MRKISREEVEAMVEYIKDGHTQAEACEKWGYTRGGLSLAAKRLNIELPSRARKGSGVMRQRALAYVDKVQSGEMSHLDVANAIGCSRAYVNRIYRAEGYDSPLCLWSKTGTYYKDEAQVVLDYIMENGGTVASVIKELGVKIHPITVRKHIKEQGIDIQQYRYKGQRHGLWLLQEGFVDAYKADFRINAICTGCGTMHQVLMTNMKTGQSTGCRDCANKGGKGIKVMNEETGEVFRSIMSFVKEIGKMKKYQTIRLAFIRTGKCDYEGETYVLVE